MTQRPPPPDPAEAAYLRENHGEFVDLFMALSVARYLAGGRGGGQGVFYECRSRLKHSIKNAHVTCMTRMFAQQYPHMPLYTFNRSKSDPVEVGESKARVERQPELFGVPA